MRASTLCYDWHVLGLQLGKETDQVAGRAAASKVQTRARRAGAAWNRHDTAAVRANLELAIEKGEPRLRVQYGGVKILHDLRHDDGTLLGAAMVLVHLEPPVLEVPLFAVAKRKEARPPALTCDCTRVCIPVGRHTCLLAATAGSGSKSAHDRARTPCT